MVLHHTLHTPPHTTHTHTHIHTHTHTHTHTRRDVDVRSKAVLHLCAVLAAGPHVVPADVFDVEVERALPADARGRAPPPGQQWLRRHLGRATGVVEDGPRDDVPDLVVVVRAVVLRHCSVCK